MKRVAGVVTIGLLIGCQRGASPRPLVEHPPASTTRALDEAPAEIVALRFAAVVDVDAGVATSNQTVVVGADGRILEIGPHPTLPPGAETIDLSEYTALPGLMDAHTHLCSAYEPRWHAEELLVQSLASPTGMRAILGVAHARQMLDAGFTTVRDLGNAGDYADIDLREAIERDIVPGPTIVAAGRIIAPYGGQFSWRVRDEVLDDPEYIFADSRDELRKAIRTNIYNGADVIKIVVDGQPYGYSEDDIRFIVAEAGEAGRKVAAHCQSSRGVKRALAAGVASIEHGWKMDAEDFARAREAGIALVSTDFTVPVLQGFGWDSASAEAIHEARVDRLRRAYQAGVTVVFGTDVMVAVEGETRGTLALGYIHSFVEAGVPQAEILRAATSHAAELLGVEDERGRLLPGLMADIIAVEGNPLEDVSVLERVAFVMKDGEVFRQPGRAAQPD